MKILILGAAIIDKMMWVDRLPRSGDDVSCTRTLEVVGGCAFNVASTLRNLHVPHDLCVPVGKGYHADVIRRVLSEKGYPLLIEDGRMDNGYCITLVEREGERSFITVQGAECDFQEEWFRNLDISSYDMIYVAGYQTLGKSGDIITRWLLRSMAEKTTLFLAPGPVINDIPPEVMDRFFSLSPVIHLNEKELQEYTGEERLEDGLAALYEKSGNTIIVTLGKKGSAMYEEGRLTIVPTAPVPVVDTVGAGDSHIAAIMGFLAKGEPLGKTVEKANQVSGITVQVSGPTVDEDTFLQMMKEK